MSHATTHPGRHYPFEPLTDNCTKHLDRAEHGVLAVSTFNSYYSTAAIEKALSLTLQKFSAVDIIAPGMESCIVLEAGGVPRAKAQKRVRKNVRKLRRHVFAALEHITGSATYAENHMYTFSDLEKNSTYDALFTKITQALQHDELFLEYCVKSARAVYTRLHNEDPNREQLVASTPYFVAEAAVMTDSPGIFGHDSSVLCYHRTIEFAEMLFHHKLSWKPSERQGYAVLNVSSLLESDVAARRQAPARPLTPPYSTGV